MAARDLLGTHDFTSFAASGGQIKNKVRTMYYVNVAKMSNLMKLFLTLFAQGFYIIWFVF